MRRLTKAERVILTAAVSAAAAVVVKGVKLFGQGKDYLFKKSASDCPIDVEAVDVTDKSSEKEL